MLSVPMISQSVLLFYNIYIYIYIYIISLFSHMVIHYVTHIKHVLKWYSSNVNKIMKKNNHL